MKTHHNVILSVLGLAACLTSALAQDTPTYANEVSRIIQAKCQQCHRPGDIAPFSLMNYEDAVAYAPEIRSAVGEKRMPPWKPVEGYGEFKGASRKDRESPLQSLLVRVEYRMTGAEYD